MPTNQAKWPEGKSRNGHRLFNRWLVKRTFSSDNTAYTSVVDRGRLNVWLYFRRETSIDAINTDTVRRCRDHLSNMIHSTERRSHRKTEADIVVFTGKSLHFVVVDGRRRTAHAPFSAHRAFHSLPSTLWRFNVFAPTSADGAAWPSARDRRPQRGQRMQMGRNGTGRDSRWFHIRYACPTPTILHVNREEHFPGRGRRTLASQFAGGRRPDGRPRVDSWRSGRDRTRIVGHRTRDRIRPTRYRRWHRVVSSHQFLFITVCHSVNDGQIAMPAVREMFPFHSVNWARCSPIMTTGV